MSIEDVEKMVPDWGSIVFWQQSGVDLEGTHGSPREQSIREDT